MKEQKAQQEQNQTSEVKETKVKSFAREVYETLSSINVNHFTEKKVNLTYLSWSWAWQVLLQHYPESRIDEQRKEINHDGSVMVYTTLTVAEGDNSLTRTMWLPVMNHKNNAIINPNAREISDAMMRCLVKCISLFGLGLYIYAGEDLPLSEIEANAQLNERVNELKRDIEFMDTLDKVNHALKEITALRNILDEKSLNNIAVLFKKKVQNTGFVYNKEKGLYENDKAMEIEEKTA